MKKGIEYSLLQYADMPISHHLILSQLGDYKRPNDKIHELIKEGVLVPLKKGLYIVGPAIEGKRPEPFLLANNIYGPSYVSLESALSFYGLIPEKVFEVSSMTTKVSKQFFTPVGSFTYTKLPLPYYAFGIRQVQFSDKEVALMATPEKALCDKIITTPGIRFRSRSQVLQYLEEDLRIDRAALADLSSEVIVSWLKDAPKNNSLKILLSIL